MRMNWIPGAIGVGAILATAAAGYAAPPSVYHATFYVHESPADPNSPLLYEMTFTLEPAETAGNLVGWQVVKSTLVRPDGGEDHVFFDAAPAVDTPDGLWWVEHDDIDTPVIAEFSATPPMSGLALANEPADTDLEYSFDGHGAYTPSGGSSQFLAFASVTFVIIESGDPQPVKEGNPLPMPISDDEPAPSL